MQKAVPYGSASDACRLHTLDYFVPQPTRPTGVWVIYVHGGAWRDPAIDSSSFGACQALHLSDPRISGLASMNYRLSAYSSHPSLPSSPDDVARNAKHPDHLQDVIAGIKYLQDRFGFEDRYVLAGHSCGATLALQIIQQSSLPFPKPCAAMGVSGIYDLPTFAVGSTYERDIVVNAYGEDENLWQQASPVAGRFDEAWPEAQAVVIASSADDELIGLHQAASMTATLEKQLEGGPKLISVALEGKHDQVWKEGRELSRALDILLEAIKSP
ncbi:MAG: hypothetical protein M1814_004353 [Vezdaea aestivalis]|nr:MAG: hypothetical protein M1814_004353 [Vezdaea aestivalis]